MSINRRLARSRIITRERNHQRAISSKFFERARACRRAATRVTIRQTILAGRVAEMKKVSASRLSDKRRTSLLIESSSVDLSRRSILASASTLRERSAFVSRRQIRESFQISNEFRSITQRTVFFLTLVKWRERGKVSADDRWTIVTQRGQRVVDTARRCKMDRG